MKKYTDFHDRFGRIFKSGFVNYNQQCTLTLVLKKWLKSYKKICWSDKT